jgi:heat-inducible transcriptional repressor
MEAVLDERKYKILEIIIKNYLETGEPVGSRTISKAEGLNVSPATIRNEMSDLEEMGYIIQPHTSSGRVPSDKGYRVYVDKMLEDREREIDELKDTLIKKSDRLDEMLKEAAKTLANTTDYAAMVSSPRKMGDKLKFIQLSRIDRTHIVAVIVSGSNVIKHTMLETEEELANETVLKLNILLNTCLAGLSADEITLTMIRDLKKSAGIHSKVVESVIDAVAGAVVKSDNQLKLYTSGTRNIFKYPELTADGKAGEIIGKFEEQDELTQLAEDALKEALETGETGIQVYIGSETPAEGMEDCSVITATYDIGDGMKGTLGVIGPRRMDYRKAIGAVKSMMSQLQNLRDTGGAG